MPSKATAGSASDLVDNSNLREGLMKRSTIVVVTSLLSVVCATLLIRSADADNGPTRTGWYLRVCRNNSVSPKIHFRIGGDEQSANDFSPWEKANPSANGWTTVSGSYDEKDFPANLRDNPDIWVSAEGDPHGQDEVCVMFRGNVKQGMTFSKDENKHVDQGDSGHCHC